MNKLSLLLSGVALTAASTAFAATPASFPGGEEALATFLSENMRYPARAIENGIEGVVRLNVAIGADGSIGKVSVARPLDPDLEQEAIRLVGLMPAWEAATDDAGAAVSQTVTLPVKFRLP